MNRLSAFATFVVVFSATLLLSVLPANAYLGRYWINIFDIDGFSEILRIVVLEWSISDTRPDVLGAFGWILFGAPLISFLMAVKLSRLPGGRSRVSGFRQSPGMHRLPAVDDGELKDPAYDEAEWAKAEYLEPWRSNEDQQGEEKAIGNENDLSQLEQDDLGALDNEDAFVSAWLGSEAMEGAEEAGADGAKGDALQGDEGAANDGTTPGGEGTRGQDGDTDWWLDDDPDYKGAGSHAEASEPGLGAGWVDTAGDTAGETTRAAVEPDIDLKLPKYDAKDEGTKDSEGDRKASTRRRLDGFVERVGGVFMRLRSGKQTGEEAQPDRPSQDVGQVAPAEERPVPKPSAERGSDYVEQLMRWHAVWSLVNPQERTQSMRQEAIFLYTALHQDGEGLAAERYGMAGINAMKALVAAAHAEVADEDDGGSPHEGEDDGFDEPFIEPVDDGVEGGEGEPAIERLEEGAHASQESDDEGVGGELRSSEDEESDHRQDAGARDDAAGSDEDEFGEPWAGLEAYGEGDDVEEVSQAPMDELDELNALFGKSSSHRQGGSTGKLNAALDKLLKADGRLRAALSDELDGAQGDDAWIAIVIASRAVVTLLDEMSEEEIVLARQSMADDRERWWIDEGAQGVVTASGSREEREEFERKLMEINYD